MAEKQLIRVPVITGPTASGKTALALSIAEEAGWDILSCDSRQIYHGMDIGTAKPRIEELTRVHHWLIDIVEPSEAYSLYRFTNEATDILCKLHKRNRVGLICGGTGLYLRGLTQGVGPQEESDPAIRNELTMRAQMEGCESLHDELKEKDPVAAARIHQKDLQRTIRALSVFYQTGKPISVLHREHRHRSDFELVVIKITIDRELLYKRINERVDNMVKSGLYEEFLMLTKMGYDEQSPGMHCVGYREFFAVERNECSFKDAVELIKRNTRRYAKRQVTWFSHQQTGMEIDLTTVKEERWREQIKKKFFDNTTS